MKRIKLYSEKEKGAPKGYKPRSTKRESVTKKLSIPNNHGKAVIAKEICGLKTSKKSNNVYYKQKKPIYSTCSQKNQRFVSFQTSQRVALLAQIQKGTYTFSCTFSITA